MVNTIIDIANLSLKITPNTKNIIDIDAELPKYEFPFIIENDYEKKEEFIKITQEKYNKITLFNFYMALKKNNIIIKDGNTYKLTKDINLSHYFKDNDTFIEIKENEIFDGQYYSINYGYLKTGGLFSISPDIKLNHKTPIIKNIDIYGGFLYSYGGFIIRNFQKNFILENCCVYSDNNSKNSGNIVGAYCGYKGSCIIRNCYSKGFIGLQNSGGIAGSYAGYKGICNIENCYSIGNIYNSGGIAGSYAGYKGICNISYCFNVGKFISDNCGGITHTNTGSYGICNIKACYSNSLITQDYCSGIVGNYASVNGLCNIEFCYHNNDNVIETSSGIVGLIYKNNLGEIYINNCFTNSNIHTFLFDNDLYKIIKETNTYSDRSSMINNRGGLYNINLLRTNLDNLNKIYYDERDISGISNNKPILKSNNKELTINSLQRSIFSTIFYSYQLNYDNKETYYDNEQKIVIKGFNDNNTLNYKLSDINNKILYKIMNNVFTRIIIDDKLLIYRDYLKRLFIKPFVKDIYITPQKKFYQSKDNISIKFSDTTQELILIIN